MSAHRFAVVLWNEDRVCLVHTHATAAENLAAWEMATSMDDLWVTNCEIRMWPEDAERMPDHVAAACAKECAG